MSSTFLPRGRTFAAHALRHPDLAVDLEPLAEHLVGDALVRFSSPTVEPQRLACAVRFRHDPDLPWLPVVPTTANVDDFLANDYYAVSPFDVGLVHALHFRLRPERPRRHVIGDRDARIEDAVARGVATLEVDVSAGPLGPWSPIVRIALLHPARVDREALGPRRAARPRIIDVLLRGIDAMSDWARPRTVP